MADHDMHTHREYVRETDARTGTSALAFILGGVVAVLVLLAVLFWDNINGTTSIAPADAPSGNVDVTIEAPAPAASDPAPAPGDGDPAPAPAE